MASDNDSAVYRQLNACELLGKAGDADIGPFMKLPARDLRQHIEPLDDAASPDGVAQGITQVFGASAEAKGSVVRIDDVGRAELQIVDSNHKIHSILKALYVRQSNARLAHIGSIGKQGNDDDDEGGYDYGNNWDQNDTKLLGKIGKLFLDWPLYSFSKKCNLFSRHACHELNFFLFKKDREFFDKVVRDLIKNKMEKTFVDKYLLGLSQDS